jgi:tetratricopeptide (TPR) repeat protein
MLERGAALLADGRFQEAMALYAQVLRSQPDSLPARIGLARAQAGAGDAFAAGAWLSDAMRVAPDASEPVQLLADLLLQQKLHAQALPLYLRLLRQFGARSAANWLHAGFCQEQVGDIENAAASYRNALAVAPDLMEAHVDLAGVLWRLEDFEGSLVHAQRAVALAPDHPYARRILGTALLQSNRCEQAATHLRRALELQPDFQLAELDLALALLLAGDLPEGWRWWERRWRDPRLQRPAFFRPDCEWRGPAVPVAGQAIAVYGEQGWGDVLQMLRYLPMLQALGATVHGVFARELVPLVEASFPGVTCLGPGRDLQAQMHAALLDLPGRFGTTLASIPSQVPYLRPPAAARARWGELLQPWAQRVRVGLAWSGSQAQINNRNRALPLSLFAPLLQRAGVQCFSLQKGDAGAWTDVAPAAQGLVDLTPHWSDFGESAAMIEQLDLVITVDTAIAHLAGALGKPAWILLPPNPDWRWLRDRDDSPWYPGARLFRRAHGEPRSAQMERALAALNEWVNGRYRA